MRTLLILLVKAYQMTLSPLFSGCCRFEPSCSNYMIEALRVHGAAKGTVLGLWRLMRCHPFYNGPLYDPVPPPKARCPSSGGKDLNTPKIETSENRSAND